MKIKFFGAAGTVTGSCYLLTPKSGQSILIDCGIFQGSSGVEDLNYAKLACDCSTVGGLILTHAHLDHCGRLPMLLSQGFSQNIWMTAPTADITEISLLDSEKINREDRSKHILFTKEGINQTLGLVRTVEYDKPFPVSSFLVTLRDAGHILGSASIEIVDQSSKGDIQKIVFSGDLGDTPQDLIRATEPIDSGDVIVLESTYGDRLHPENNPSDTIQSEINAIESNGGTLLIPAFSIERSQEVLHRINHLKNSGKINNETTVYFDSPMGEKTTQVFKKYRQYYNDELKNDLLTDDPFTFPGLVIIKSHKQSLAIHNSGNSKVIIAGSGMMSGGRIVNHAFHYLPISTTRVLIVGYQARGTLGRALLEGKSTVDIIGTAINVQAQINQTQAMSSHADQSQLLKWLGNIKGVKKVFLTHGEDESRLSLAEKIKSETLISDVTLPTFDQEVTLA